MIMTTKQLKSIANKHLDEFDLNEGVFPAIMKAMKEAVGIAKKTNQKLTERQVGHIYKIISKELGGHWVPLRIANKIKKYLNRKKHNP